MTISRSLHRDFMTYSIGYGLAVLLTGIAFACVLYHVLSPHMTFGVVLGLALIQISSTYAASCIFRSNARHGLICN